MATTKDIVDSGHWVSESEPVDPKKFFGFIYKITNTVTGSLYIGRKNFWIKKGKLKGCKSTPSTDRQSPKWKERCWKESDWRTYKGSSKHLAKEFKKYGAESFKFRILKQCRSRGTLHYSEVEALVKAGAMVIDSKYLNRTCPAIRYKVPLIYKEETKLDLQSEEIK